MSKQSESGLKFSFSNVADHFDEHISKSIPGYDLLRYYTKQLSRYFVENDSSVIDIGCSRGTLLLSIKEENTQAKNVSYFGIDIDNEFSKYWADVENVKFQKANILDMDLPKNSTFIYSLFTLQFLPERHRFDIIKKIYDSLLPGGAFLFSEKMISMDPKMQNICDSIFHEFKRTNFSDKEILDKEKELRHLMKCETELDLLNKINKAGFQKVQCMWRNYNFAAFIAIKY